MFKMLDYIDNSISYNIYRMNTSLMAPPFLCQFLQVYYDLLLFYFQAL